MKFKLVEDKLLESDVSDINKVAKQVMIKQAKETTDIDPTFFQNCLRHHINGKIDYETPQQLKQGLLNPSINISTIQDPDMTANAIHFMIEHYTGKGFFDLINFISRICNQDAVYHCSNTGSPVFKKDKLYKIIQMLNRAGK